VIKFHGISMPEGAALSWPLSDIVIRRKNGFAFRCRVRGCSLLDQRPVSALPRRRRERYRQTTSPEGVKIGRRSGVKFGSRLTGMDSAVIYKQLADHRSGKRLWGVMEGMAKALSVKDSADVASYFAGRPGGLPAVTGLRVPEAGRTLRQCRPRCGAGPRGNGRCPSGKS